MKPNPSATKLIYQEKVIEREIWHKLVVKVLCWKDGLLEGGSIKSSDKITVKEWKTYCQKIMETNIISGREKSLANLKITEQLIKNHNGFE